MRVGQTVLFLVEYGDLAYRVICLRWQQFRSDTRGEGRVCGSGVVVGGIDVIDTSSILASNMDIV